MNVKIQPAERETWEEKNNGEEEKSSAYTWKSAMTHKILAHIQGRQTECGCKSGENPTQLLLLPNIISLSLMVYKCNCRSKIIWIYLLIMNGSNGMNGTTEKENKYIDSTSSPQYRHTNVCFVYKSSMSMQHQKELEFFIYSVQLVLIYPFEISFLYYIWSREHVFFGLYMGNGVAKFLTITHYSTNQTFGFICERCLVIYQFLPYFKHEAKLYELKVIILLVCHILSPNCLCVRWSEQFEPLQNVRQKAFNRLVNEFHL